MAQFIYDGRTKAQWTGHEAIAARNIHHAINWIVGGYYNCIQDHCPEYLPESREALEAEIYDSAMQNRYAPGYEGYNKAPKEMRFAGEKFCRAYIAWKLDHDDDYQEIAAFQNFDHTTDDEEEEDT